MNYIVVRLWDKELGRLAWDSVKRTTYFMFNPDLKQRPDVTPLLRSANEKDKGLPMYGDSRRIYQNLPPFLADSLPDSWGNKLFDQWIRHNRISRSKVTPLDKLIFIGRRGMGALEFHPAVEELEHARDVNLKSLYDLSIEIMNRRESVTLNSLDDITFQSLLSVGTSAGGRQMKAIVAINPATGEIRSGQIADLKGFDYFIIKFEDEVVPTSEIEMVFYEMAVAGGIDMEECRLLRVEGVTHFMTRRFDRKEGRKIHMQTLAAINPEAESYEDLMDTCRRLQLTDGELQELFRRLVFNVLANNTDDHNKNFSFLLEQDGQWKLSPAYDMTFIFAADAHHPQPTRCMSLYGKISEITKDDLLDFAKDNSIRNAEEIIKKIADALMLYPALAKKYNIPAGWSNIIHKTLRDNLIRFGYIIPSEKSSEFMDKYGRDIKCESLTINSKGYYRLNVTIDGKPRRRFIKPDTDLFDSLHQYEMQTLPDHLFISLIERIFPD